MNFIKSFIRYLEEEKWEYKWSKHIDIISTKGKKEKNGSLVMEVSNKGNYRFYATQGLSETRVALDSGWVLSKHPESKVQVEELKRVRKLEQL